MHGFRSPQMVQLAKEDNRAPADVRMVYTTPIEGLGNRLPAVITAYLVAILRKSVRARHFCDMAAVPCGAITTS